VAGTDNPKPRKVLVVLTDAEWRQLRVIAMDDETTIQGWLTTVTLAALQERGRST
jgi:hypothetical protein